MEKLLSMVNNIIRMEIGDDWFRNKKDIDRMDWLNKKDIDRDDWFSLFFVLSFLFSIG